MHARARTEELLRGTEATSSERPTVWVQTTSSSPAEQDQRGRIKASVDRRSPSPGSGAGAGPRLAWCRTAEGIKSFEVSLLQVVQDWLGAAAPPTSSPDRERDHQATGGTRNRQAGPGVSGSLSSSPPPLIRSLGGSAAAGDRGRGPARRSAAEEDGWRTVGGAEWHGAANSQ